VLRAAAVLGHALTEPAAGHVASTKGEAMLPTSTATAPKRVPSQSQVKPILRPNGKFSRNGSKPEPRILFQKYFKSVGPRTYAAQLMQAGNGNHYLVLTEGKRDDASGEVRKTKLFVFSEDFDAFKAMLHDAFAFIQSHPVPADVRQKREKFWAKRQNPGSRQEGRGRPGEPRSTQRRVLDHR